MFVVQAIRFVGQNVFFFARDTFDPAPPEKHPAHLHVDYQI